MRTSAISRRYARALVDLAVEQKAVDTYSEELVGLAAAFEQEEMLRLILESPTYPLEKKQAILTDLGKALKLSTGMQNFIGLLMEKGRIDQLAVIGDDYRRLADERTGVVRARIISAQEMADKQEKAISSALEKQTGKRVELAVATDASLLGGLQAEIAGRLFDGSLRSQLKRIEDTLTKG
ncbi:MAG: ATP synthase F1 subunit delta [Desulfuromonas sp.]|nr:MAG: ATP synthase F1 subunit delta [Desulfuromonas sp.]